MDYADNEILNYDLGFRPASFDFVTCLSTAKALGIKHVRFVLGRWKKKNYTLEQAEERYRSIVEPAVALFGLTYSVGDPAGIPVSHFFTAALEVYKKTGKTGKIIVPCVAKDYVTVTLRKSRNPERDSKEDEWLKWAAQCNRKVIILRDYDERPLDLADRMQLYAGAYMNLMVINGPLTLCIHSDAPYISMRTIGCERSGSTSPSFMKQLGITNGFQFPWANARQKLSYLDDTVENIEAEYRAITQERQAA